MKLHIVLGNQLFPIKYLEDFKDDHIIFMAEDNGLCTYEKHHKLKILLFLSAMRSYADNLKKNNFKIEYLKIGTSDFKKEYLEKLKKIIKSKNISEITIGDFSKKNKIKWNTIKSPMFLNSREEFNNYLIKNSRPFMATFYKNTRKKLNILMKKDGKPEGGKWSFDEDNRKKLPKDIKIPNFPNITETKHTKNLKPG